METVDNTNTEYQFIKETIKERPLNKRKLLLRIIMVLISAMIFGAVSAGVFLLTVRQAMSGTENGPDPVNIPKDEEVLAGTEETEEIDSASENEASTEASTEASEEASTEAFAEESKEGDAGDSAKAPTEIISYNVTEHVSLSVEDYKSLYRSLKEVASETLKSVVTVTTVVNDTDWFDNSYENENSVTGLIVANNGKDLLILAEMPESTGDMELSVTFDDGMKLSGEIKSGDPDTGLAIISVPLDKIPDDTKDAIKEAELGSSRGVGAVGIPVMALGSPLGIQGSQCYGRTTSNQRELSLPDKNVHVLSTDIYGSDNATGIITDYDGHVIGIISKDTAMEDAPNLLSAYGISDLKEIIENLSNGSSECFLGIYGTDVTPEINEEEDVPIGLYVTKVALDSPAMEGGIQSGDVITRMGTADIASFRDYSAQLMKYKPGDEAVITVQRFSQGEFLEMPFEVTFADAVQRQE